MSAFAEFEEERRQIDSLLGQGYTVAGIMEDLDGARVKFIRREQPSGAPVELLLLTADARKHVTAVLHGGTGSVKALEAHA